MGLAFWRAVTTALAFAASTRAQFGTYVEPDVLDACSGYNATDVQTSDTGLTASLALVGDGCAIFGSDIQTLSLQVTYESETRLHVKITDASSDRYEVPVDVFPRPSADDAVSASSSQLSFNYTSSPFAFTVARSSTGEVLFDTSSHPIIFESQYLRVKTALPEDANIFGLGEHTDNFRLPTWNTTRTFWSRDAYGIPTDTNLYGNHPIYFEHRATGTHAVFLLNSNGMDIKINSTSDGSANETSLEYNVIGGVLDFYFLAGSESDPTEAARQYAEVAGFPAEMPYWSFGFHQCRYGYNDFTEVANVITNYSAAGIPLETMWTDIDYMDKRWIFTTDPDYFPLDRMREIVDYLHAHEQQYVLMTDPAVAYQPNQSYGTFDRGIEAGIFLKEPTGNLSFGVVWPGVTVFPDWFNPDTQDFWTGEFGRFYNATAGIDIDGAWIDMNEPASFCVYPCDDPDAQAVENGDPPNRTTEAPDPSASIFDEAWPLPSGFSWVSNDTSSTSNTVANRELQKRLEMQGMDWNWEEKFAREILSKRVASGDDLFNPPYNINNALPQLSSRTAYVDIVHDNGLVMYDTHNLYGSMMSTATRNAMIARRPGLRPLVITRSTFAGAGKHTGKWLGDNLSEWYQYRLSIAGMLGFASIYQMPMVGSDICGYGDNTTETLCARWATLGAFYPFMRNHNTEGTISQEFYRWPLTTQAAQNAIAIRYRLLDYFYTAFHQQHTDGTPVVSPLWFKYPKDKETYAIEHQFFFGDAIFVSPVTDENVTSVEAYVPDDVFYDFYTLQKLDTRGANTTFEADYTSIPLAIKGGSIIPMRVNGTMTTAELRKTDFEILVAPDDNGTACGVLYFDDGLSINPNATTEVSFTYSNGTLSVDGTFDAPLGVDVKRAVFLGVGSEPESVIVDGAVKSGGTNFNGSSSVLTVELGFVFDHAFTIDFAG